MKTLSTKPAVKIRMMKASLRCLAFGLLGWLPIIGLPFALAALWFSSQARAQEKYFWNPARRHRILGVACAALGAVVWSGVDMLLLFRACESYVSG